MIYIGLELSSGGGGQVVIFKPFLSLVVARLCLATVPTIIEPVYHTEHSAQKFHPVCEHLTSLIAVATGDQVVLVEYGHDTADKCIIRFQEDFSDISNRLKSARSKKNVLGFKPGVNTRPYCNIVSSHNLFPTIKGLI